MARKDDQEAAQMLREFETRLVWIIGLHASLAGNGGSVNQAVHEANDVLDRYQEKFPPIQPPE